MTSNQLERCLTLISAISKLSCQARIHKALSGNLAQQLLQLQEPLMQCQLWGVHDDRWRSLQPSLEELLRHLAHAEAAMSACCSDRVLFKLVLGDSLREELISVTLRVISAAAAARLYELEEEEAGSAPARGGAPDPLESSGPVWALKKGLLPRAQLISALCEEKLLSEDDLLHLQTQVEEARQRKLGRASPSPQDEGLKYLCLASHCQPPNPAPYAGQLNLDQASGSGSQPRRDGFEDVLEQIRGGVKRLREPVPAAVEVEPTVRVPHSFLCPITHDIMWEPVIVAETGNTYGREAIQEWLKEHNTDPLSHTEIPVPAVLVPNRSLRATITSVLCQQAPYSRLHEQWWPSAKVAVLEIQDKIGTGKAEGEAGLPLRRIIRVKRRRTERTAQGNDHSRLRMQGLQQANGGTNNAPLLPSSNESALPQEATGDGGLSGPSGIAGGGPAPPLPPPAAPPPPQPQQAPPAPPPPRVLSTTPFPRFLVWDSLRARPVPPTTTAATATTAATTATTATATTPATRGPSSAPGYTPGGGGAALSFRHPGSRDKSLAGIPAPATIGRGGTQTDPPLRRHTSTEGGGIPVSLGNSRVPSAAWQGPPTAGEGGAKRRHSTGVVVTTAVGGRWVFRPGSSSERVLAILGARRGTRGSPSSSGGRSIGDGGALPNAQQSGAAE